MFASALVLIAGVSTASAQSVPRTSWGIVAGANFAKLTGDDIDNVKTRTGFVGGITADFHLARHVGLEIDGLYSQEGTKIDIGDSDGTLKLDYIRVPVLLRFNFPTHTTVHPFVNVGPSLGFKISCKETAGGDSANCDDISSTDVKSFDFAGTVGAGIGFAVGKQELSVQARFTKGFSKIIEDTDAKNQNFSVMAGFKF
jgi:hypothetical protein